MTREELEQLCAAYSLGTLDDKDQELLEEHSKKDGPALQESLSKFGGVVTRLLFEAEPVAPRPELKKTILEQVKAESEKEEDKREQSPFFFLKADEGTWQSVGEGVTARVLFEDTKRKITTMLVRMAAGSTFPGHSHGGPEELYVLEGDCNCAGELLGSGDYHRAESHSKHGITSTIDGCLMLVISPEIEIIE